MKSLRPLSILSAIASFHQLVHGAYEIRLCFGNEVDYEKTSRAATRGFAYDGRDTPLSLVGLRDIAKGHYEWLKTQSSYKNQDSRSASVAEFWDPTNRVVYASTVPRAPYRDAMIEAATQLNAAPVWYNQVRTFLHGNNPNVHAEDAALFDYEVDFRPQGPDDKPYPDGSMIAVYGIFEYPSQAKPRLPCRDADRRNPTCLAVANNLHIEWAKDAAERARWAPAQVTTSRAASTTSSSAPTTSSSAPESDDDLDGSLPDADLLGAQAQGAPATADPAAQPDGVEFAGESLSDADSHAVYNYLEVGLGPGGPQHQQRHWDRRDGLRKRNASSSTPIASGWRASIEALKGTYKPPPLSINTISVSLPAIDFDIRTTGNVSMTSASSDGLNSTINTSSFNTSSAAPPKMTCSQQNQDPDAGIYEQGCICTSGTVTETLPILATNVDPSSSCAYTAVAPSKTTAITTDWGPPYTNTQICSACTPTTDFGAGTCTSIPSCTPQRPYMTMQVGSSRVPVGTLTSSDLSASIASAVSVLCPS